VSALATLPNGDVVAGGYFTSAGGVPASSIARWNGTSWSALGAGVNSVVYTLANLSNGNIVAGGSFSAAGGEQVSSLARFDPTSSTWSAIVFGTSSTNIEVRALLALENGDVLAGGTFSHAGATRVNRIARWNGTAWSPLGSGLDVPINSIAALPNGNIVVGCDRLPVGPFVYPVALWNGTTWSTLGVGMNSEVRALLTLPDGDIVAGGDFTIAGGVPANRIARWNGTAWSALGSGFSSGTVRALITLPNGDIVAGGTFSTAGGVPASAIARWNGVAWSPIGSGLGFEAAGTVTVNALALLPNGDIVAGGSFNRAGEVASSSIARWGIPAGCRSCDSVDFNADTLFPSDQDLVDFLSVLAGGACSTGTCNDIDFDNDGLFPDDNDLLAFLRVLAGGEC
jgi:hypothetical protein